MRKALKKYICIGISLLCALNAIISLIDSVKLNAKLSDGIGTGAGLNSPVINNTFVEDNWNRWEMVCWGVFLSNFCTPFVDDYESALSSTSNYGSRGNGYNALCFGSGSDSVNNETIEKLTNYAINTRNASSAKPIFIGTEGTGANAKTSKLDGSGKPVKVELSSYDSNVEYKEATIQDLFISDGVREKKSIIYDGDIIKDCTLNSFYIQNGDQFYEVWDNLDSWDIQVLGCLIAKTYSSPLSDKMVETVNKAFDAKSKLYWDCFGNICVNDENGRLVVIIPSCANQHITNEPKINLINSVVMNNNQSGNTTYTGEDLLAYGSQSVCDPTAWTWFKNLFIPSGLNKSNNGEAGVNPLDANISSNINGMTALYYDTDTIKTQEAVLDTSNDVTYGKILSTLFKMDGTATTNAAYTLKIGVLGADEILGKLNAGNGIGKLAITYNSMSAIADQCNTVKDQEFLTYYRNMQGEKVELLSNDAVYVPVQLYAGKHDGKYTYGYIPRQFMNYLGNRYNGINAENTVTGLSLESFRSAIDNMVYPDSFSGALLMDEYSNVRDVYKDFINLYSGSYFRVTKGDLSNISSDLEFGTKIGIVNTMNSGISNSKLQIETMDTDSDVSWLSKKLSNAYGSYPGRVIKTWGQSDVMCAISNYLNISEGTEFSTYSSMIYLSYLDYYGLDSSKNRYGEVTKTSDFKESLFNWCTESTPDDISNIIDSVSESDMQQEIVRLGYLSLSTSDEAREYRATLMNQGIQDFIYGQYLRVVYGTSGADSSSVTSKSNAGFLRVHTYDENFLTSWFIKIYSNIAIWLIGIFIILVVILGLMKGKKASWYVMTIIVAVNTILILPSLGEIVPYVANRSIQSIFSNKMTFWSLSEQITDYKQQSAFNSSKKLGSSTYFNGLTEEEKRTVLGVIDTVESLQLDRSLMVKQDISNKTVNVDDSVSNKIQQYQSTRWLLPMVMQQYSSSDSKDPYSYVYVNMGDTIDDAANCYWYFNPDAANNVDTVPAKSDKIDSKYTTNGGSPRNLIKFNGYINQNEYTYDKNSNYLSFAYTRPTTDNNMDNKYHRYFYIANTDNVDYSIGNTDITKYNGFHEDKDIEAFYNDNKNFITRDTMVNMADVIEKDATRYNRNDRITYSSMIPYLQATESPLEYFYMVTNEQFSNDSTYAYLVAMLQGGFEENDEGNEVRTGLCYNSKGEVVDVLDLEHMFKEMIPYMYGMEIMAGGSNGNSGHIGEDKIENYTLYEGTSRAWLFNSNWVTKIIENPQYCKETEIGLGGDKEKVKIQNQAIPQEYEKAGRQMVFSEAQKNELGLKDSDLSLCELQCIEINKQVSRKWTYLLNYAGTNGINKEIMIRQMALDAELIFNSNITSAGLLSTKFKMYPSSIDLRSISFDSIMKMLCLNVSKDTSYLYGNTMQTLIGDSDLFTSVLLLICAFLCCYGVSLIRDIAMAILLYNGIISIVYHICSTNKSKLKMTLGAGISTVVISIASVVYYGLIGAMISMTSNEDVLNVNSVSIEAGNPVWMIIFIIAISCIYIYVLVRIIIMLFRYTPSQVMEIAANLAESTRESASRGFRNLGNRVRGLGNEYSSGFDRMGNWMDSYYERENSNKNDSNINQTEVNNVTNERVLESDNNDIKGDTEINNINDINSEIEKGKANM